MNITGFTFTNYKLKLNKPFLSSGAVLRERKGFWVTLKSDEFEASGDIAPLPEFGSETFATAENILRELSTSFPYLPVSFSGLKDVEDALKEMNSFPAIRHGIEQALISLLIKVNKTTIGSLLGQKTKDRIALNSVIDLVSPRETAEAVKRHINAGYKTIKLKAGRKNFKEDLECIGLARSTAGSDVNIRIDVNGKWEFDEALDNLNELEEFNLEYAEQPVRTISDLAELSKLSGVTVAADEAVRTLNGAFELINNKYCPVLVLKPMMYGGILNSLKIINEAERNGIKLVISSSFESLIGKKAALFLAATVKGEHAHGLGTDEYTTGTKEKLNIISGMVLTDNQEYFLT